MTPLAGDLEVSHYSVLAEMMEAALESEQPQAALDLYQQEVSMNGIPQDKCIRFAVMACLRLEEVTMARDICDAAELANRTPSHARVELLCSQIENEDSRANILRILYDHYDSLDSSAAPWNHKVLHAAIHQYTLVHNHKHALAVCLEVYGKIISKNIPLSRTVFEDLIFLYSDDLNLKGVFWAVSRILKHDFELPFDFHTFLLDRQNRMIGRLMKDQYIKSTVRKFKQNRWSSPTDDVDGVSIKMAWTRLRTLCRFRAAQQKAVVSEYGLQLTKLLLQEARDPAISFSRGHRPFAPHTARKAVKEWEFSPGFWLAETTKPTSSDPSSRSK